MTRSIDAYTEQQLRRWTRPDAHHFVRPDWRRDVRAGHESEFPFSLYERKYSPSQPRVPAGSPEGGQWAKDGEGATGKLSGGITLALRMTCESQYEEDLDICRRNHLQACYEQAA